MATVTIGKIGSIEGSVEVVHADGTTGSLEQGALVYADDAISTGENSSARIEFLDGSVMNIGPEFTATLDKDVFDTALLQEDEGAATALVMDSSDREVTPDSGLATEAGGKIGNVEQTEGLVEAVNENGDVRVLKAGDTLYANDVIRVGSDGTVTIRMIDGSDLSFGPGTLARMGDSDPSSLVTSELSPVVDTAQPIPSVDIAQPSPIVDTAQPSPVLDAAQIAAIIREGRDPTAEAAAPAAGETGSSEGGIPVILTPSDRAVTPTSGHNTHGFELPFGVPEPELLEPLEPEEPNSIPTLIVRYGPSPLPFTAGGPGVVDENGLPARPGEPAGTAEATPSEITDGDFLINTGTDGLQLLEVCPLDINGNPLPVGWVDVTTGGTVTGAYGFELIVTPPSAPGGNYTWSYTLPDNLDHDFAGLTGTADQLPVDFKVRVTDTSGDVTPDTPLNILINDDGPTADLTDAPGANLTIDESAGLQPDDTPDVAVSNLFTGIVANPGVDADMPQYAQSGVALFTQTIVEGADGATKALTLEIVGPNGIDSGLTTTDGHKIYLYLQNDQIVGRADLADNGASAADDAAFAIAIDADTGVVSMAQYLSLWHPIPGDGTTLPDNHNEPVNLNGLVNAVLTVTDGDGDKSVAVDGIGDQLLFTDDGPTADLSPGAVATLTIDESAGEQGDDDNADTPAPGEVSDLFIGVVSNPGTDADMPQPQYAQTVGALVTPGVLAAMAGTDDEGASAVLTLEIVGGNGTNSGLTTTDGLTINLYLESGQVVGRVDPTDDAAFAIAIGQDGTASMAQYLSLAHPIMGDGSGITHNEPVNLDGLVNAVLTVTDGDGDFSVDKEGIGDQLLFTDDGPVAVDDSVAQTAENAPVVINPFGNDVFGADGGVDNNIPTMPIPTTPVTFTQGSAPGSVVSYDAATGLFTYTQAVGQPAGPDTFMYTIEDGDGDTSTAQVTVTIVADSMPTVTVTDGIVDEKGLPTGSGELADLIPENDDSEIDTGAFTITTGSDMLSKLEVKNDAGTWINVTDGPDTDPVTGETVVQGDNGVLTVTNASGVYTWSYELMNNLDHLIDGATGIFDQIPGEAFDVRATDSDGSVSAVEVLDITVYDDGPTLESTADPLDPTEPSVLATVHEDGMSRTVVGAVPADSSDGILDPGTSRDSDEASGPASGAGSLKTLVTATVGADDPGTLTFGLVSTTDIMNDPTLLPTLFSNGDQLSYGVAGNVLTATADAGARTVFTLTVNADGSWDFDLQDQLDHVVDSNPATDGDEETMLYTGAGITPVTSIDFTAVVTASIEDADGDIVSDTLLALGAEEGSFAITVENDIPTLESTADPLDPTEPSVLATVHEDGMSRTVVGAVPADSSDGILDPGTSRDSDEASGPASGAGSLKTLVTATVGADDPGTLTFGLVSTTDIMNDPTLLPTLFSNGDQLSYGVAGNVLTATADAGARTVFTLTVNADGSWDFDLQDQLDHVVDSNPATDGDEETMLYTGAGITPVTSIDFTAVVTASIEDADGDIVSDTLLALGAEEGSFAITVENDIPVANADVDKVLVSHTTNGNVITGVDANDPNGSPDLTEADIPGADEAIVVTGVVAGTTVGVIGDPIDGTLGTLTLQANGDYEYEADPNVLGTDVFTYTITDSDGDTSTTTLSIDVGGLIVGTNNDDDVLDPAEPHTVPNQAGDPSGPILGGAGADVLVGDVGGTAATNTNANIILILDTSGSMGDMIDFDDDSDPNTPDISITRLAAQKLAVDALLTELAGSTANQVRVHIIDFNTSATSRGTFDLKVAGQLDLAKGSYASLIDDGWTNYEDALQKAIDWGTVPANLLGDAGGTLNVVNQTFFISDGKPTAYTRTNGTFATGVDADIALSQATGTDTSGSQQDIVSEVAILENGGIQGGMTVPGFGPTEAIGIALVDDPNTPSIDEGVEDVDNLNEVENEPRNIDPDAANNIFTANELIDILQDLNPLQNLAPVGNDTINGGDGDDFIFGDALFTDVLADAQGLTLGDGSGWQVFADLEATPGWDRADTIDYIQTNHVELGAESDIAGTGRTGGMDIIDAGGGDDIVYGQEGDDMITGGSGNDLLSGGSGADTFIWQDSETGTDTVTDFSTAEDDVLNIADLLDGENGLTGVGLIDTYISIAQTGGGADTTLTLFSDGSGAGADQVIELTGFSTTGMSGADIIDSLLAGPNPNLVID